MDIKKVFRGWFKKEFGENQQHRIENTDIETISVKFGEHLEKRYEGKELDSIDSVKSWVHLHIPIAVSSEREGIGMVNPFTSQHAFNKVCKFLAEDIYKNFKRR